jgi:hypothetical protein
MNHDVGISSDWRREVSVEVDAEGVVSTLFHRLVFAAKVLRRLHRFGTEAHQDLKH